MSHRIRGVVALLALVSITAGVPYALVAYVGRLWPARMPSLDLVVASVRRGDISDVFVIKCLAVLVWVTWARLMVGVVIEVAARLSGRRVPRIAGLGSAQHWAAALVAAVSLLASSSRLTLAASTADFARPIPAALLDLGPISWPTLIDTPVEDAPSVPAASTPSSSASMGRIHVVQRHESFWSIADDAWGDGARWREIVDANAGREVAPGIRFDGTPDRLLPGWQLLVPDPTATIESTAAAPNARSVAASDRTVIVEPGDTLSGIADDELGAAAAWPQIWELNQGRVFADRAFTDPNLILPGWDLLVPSAGSTVEPAFESDVEPAFESDVEPIVQAEPAADLPPSAPPVQSIPEPVPVALPMPPAEPEPMVTAAATTIPPVEPGVESPSPDADQGETVDRLDASGGIEADVPAIAGVGAAMMIASGVVGASTVRRRRRLRGAAVNERLARPSALVDELDRTVRGLDAGERIVRLDIALRAVGHALAERAPGVGVLATIVAADGRLDMLVDGAAPAPPAPWERVTDHRWGLPARVPLSALADAARRSQQPCPAIAHLGATMLDDGVGAELFVDIEALGVLAIDAGASAAISIVRAMAAGLALSPMAEVAHIITVGLDDPGLGHPSLRLAASIQDAMVAARASIGATHALTAGGLSTFVLRSKPHAGEVWEPAVVFAAARDADDPTGAQLPVVEAGRGIGLVVAGDHPGATWRLRPEGAAWVLDPLGIEVVPIGLSAVEADRLQHLLDEADAPLIEAADHELDAASVSPSWPLMVRVLGRPVVCDPADEPAPFERSKALELVVWLSQHRDRSTRSGARTALWETNVRDTTFANVVSDARRSLARLAPRDDAEEWIARTLTDDLPLHGDVITDADLLADRLRAARELEPMEAIEVLRPALALVRDIPFAGTAYLWPDTEGITSQLILLVTSAATVLAGLSLGLGDVAGVFWATGQGLRVLPGHEELIALRMRAHARAGDLAGVRDVWASYERVLAGEMWGDSAPAEKLVQLRRELLAPSLSSAVPA